MSGALTPEKIALKLALAEVVKGCGGFEASALHCRVGKSRLATQASISDEHDEEFPAIDVIADLEPLARNRPGWPHVTRELAAQQGFVLVAIPEARPTGDDHLRQLAGLMKEGGDVAGALGRALADGVLCAADRADCRRELRELIEAAVAWDRQLAEG